VLRDGSYPFTLVQLPRLEGLAFRHAPDEPLQHIPEPVVKAFV